MAPKQYIPPISKKPAKCRFFVCTGLFILSFFHAYAIINKSPAFSAGDPAARRCRLQPDRRICMEQKITRELKRLGALYTAPVKVADISFSPDLRTLCEMNSCGAFGTNWGCPPGCGTVDELSCKVREYPSGVVYQYVGALEDSFDYEGMMEAGRVFGGITDGIRSFVQANVPASFVLGAGGCTLCGTCTYPDAPCRFPERKNISVEACGINVSVLCAKCGLGYIHGPNTVTNTGVVLFRQA